MTQRGSAKTTEGETPQLRVRVPTELLEELDRIAASDPELDRSAVVRRAIREYVERSQNEKGIST